MTPKEIAEYWEQKLKDSGFVDADRDWPKQYKQPNLELINTVAALPSDFRNKDFLELWAQTSCLEACRQFNYTRWKGRQIINTFKKYLKRPHD